jgi:quinoprotein glucose dehydrogenase
VVVGSRRLRFDSPRALALIPAALILGACGGPSSEVPPDAPVVEWLDYGADRGGLRHSPLADVTRENVDQLEIAWTYRSGDVAIDGRDPRGREVTSTTAYELTPILVDGTLYGCTPFNRVFALDPETGVERWSFDPEIDLGGRYPNQLVCRGVSTWLDPDPRPGDPCARRIFTATNDARLIALDAATGLRCQDFGGPSDARGGVPGQVDLTEGVGERKWAAEYQMTSPPAIVNGRVVVGSAVSDNVRTDAPSGVLRAFDARTGDLLWAWNPVPPGFPTREMDAREGVRWALGTANVWAPLAVDEKRDLVFAPTGNTAPDYYGGVREGVDHYASSVVALRGETGEVVWHFQTVHHDVWDYDVPAQPTLATLRRPTGDVDAVLQATKMGHVFVLERETGAPLFPVEERPVPQGGVPGETLSPTQPFPVRPPPLGARTLSPDDAWGLTPWDRGACRERIEALRFEGIFTPPSLQGTIAFPGNAGGTNWGGLAVDPVRQLLVVNTSNIPFAITLFPGEEYEAMRAANPGVEIAPQRGTPFALRREALLSPLGLPCSPPPWGALTAIDLGTGEIAWQVTPGSVRDIAPIPIPWEPGVPSLGGPLVTGGGLVFLAATMDDYLRAFDVESGEELWRGRLPAGGQSTPMTYRARPGGAQYVVVAAGGHGRAGTTPGDSLVAFRLR